MIEQDNYVAWMRYKKRYDGQTVICACDSDAEGAFKVYRHQHAETDPNTPIRMYIALKLMRAWNNGTEGFDGLLVKTVNDWIDGGLKGPIPWVENPFFEEWAAANGYSRVDDFIGFRATATLIND